MKRDILAVVSAFVLFAASPAARAWDELGPLDEARRAHPEFFAKGAVVRTELDGVDYWVFAGDSDLRDGFSTLSDTERYAEAALDARRNLLRHVTGGSKNASADLSGVVTAYRFVDGSARRVVCLVPVENVRLVSSSRPAPGPAASAPTAVPAAPAPAVPESSKPAGPSAPATPPAENAGAEISAPSPAVPAGTPDAGSAGTDAPDQPPADSGLPRFSSPDLPVPAIPGQGRE